MTIQFTIKTATCDQQPASNDDRWESHQVTFDSIIDVSLDAIAYNLARKVYKDQLSWLTYGLLWVTDGSIIACYDVNNTPGDESPHSFFVSGFGWVTIESGEVIDPYEDEPQPDEVVFCQHGLRPGFCESCDNGYNRPLTED